MTTAPGTAATVQAMGECALLVELAGTGQVLELYRALGSIEQAPRPQAVLDLVPAETTLLVTYEGGPGTRRVVHDWVSGHLLSHQLPRPADPASPSTLDPAALDDTVLYGQTELVTLPVTYDGPDLDEVAELTGLSAAEVIAAHTGTDWTAVFCGFAPGFAYLAGGDPRLQVARRSTPRTRVPAGSVALAGHYCGVYPRESPGGWRLIGRTGITLWDTAAVPPAVIRPGMRVRFVPSEPTIR